MKKVRLVYSMIQQEKKGENKNLCVLKEIAGGDVNSLITELKEALEQLPKHFETFLKIEI